MLSKAIHHRLLFRLSLKSPKNLMLSRSFESSDLSTSFSDRSEKSNVSLRNKEMRELRKQFKKEVEDQATEQKERERYVYYFILFYENRYEKNESPPLFRIREMLLERYRELWHGYESHRVSLLSFEFERCFF